MITIRRGALAAAAAVVASVCGVGVAAAAPGDLDLSYGLGTGGSRIGLGEDEFGQAVALQSDGKIIVAGTSRDLEVSDPLVVRLNNPQGTFDTTFGPGTGASNVILGQQQFPWRDTVNAMALQPDGKIIVGGEADAPQADAFVARFSTPQGTLDTSYGAGFGWSRIDLGGAESANALALQPDGRIIVVGSASTDVLVARLTNPGGGFDSSYGPGGHGVSPIDLGQNEVGTAVALQPDGKIVVAGRRNAGGPSDFLAIRLLNPQGTLDGSFNASGATTVDFGGDDGAQAIVLQPDGDVLLAGSTSATGSGDFAVARLQSNGLPDNTFGSGGKATVDFGGSDTANAMALQPDGKIILVGTMVQGTQSEIAVARLQPDGTLDTTFGKGGKSIVNLVGGTESGTAVALQPDGKIIVAGSVRSPGSGFDMLVVRLQGDPAGTGGTGGTGGGGTGGTGGGTGGAGGSGGRAILRCASKKATIIGTNASDRLVGTKHADVIVALGGNDTINGGGGNDTICAGAGNDRVHGGAGNDLLDGGAGNDSLSGQAGADKLFGGPGNDHLGGGAGKDQLAGGSGRNTAIQ